MRGKLYFWVLFPMPTPPPIWAPFAPTGKALRGIPLGSPGHEKVGAGQGGAFPGGSLGSHLSSQPPLGLLHPPSGFGSLPQDPEKARRVGGKPDSSPVEQARIAHRPHPPSTRQEL